MWISLKFYIEFLDENLKWILVSSVFIYYNSYFTKEIIAEKVVGLCNVSGDHIKIYNF